MHQLLSMVGTLVAETKYAGLETYPATIHIPSGKMVSGWQYDPGTSTPPKAR